MISISVFHYSPFLSLLISSRCFSLRTQLIKRRPTPRERAQHELVRGSGGWLERCALGCVSYPLNHRHQPTCESGSLWHDSVSSGALEGTLDRGYANTWETVTKAQSASLPSVTHGNPTFRRVRSVPQVGQREEMTAQPPPGGSLRSHWSAASLFVLVLTAEQRVSPTAA